MNVKKQIQIINGATNISAKPKLKNVKRFVNPGKLAGINVNLVVDITSSNCPVNESLAAKPSFTGLSVMCYVKTTNQIDKIL